VKAAVRRRFGPDRLAASSREQFAEARLRHVGDSGKNVGEPDVPTDKVTKRPINTSRRAEPYLPFERASLFRIYRKIRKAFK
jgi:hypothetical protein